MLHYARAAALPLAIVCFAAFPALAEDNAPQAGAFTPQQLQVLALQGTVLPPQAFSSMEDFQKYEFMRRALTGRRRGGGQVVSGDPRLAIPQGYGVPQFPPGLPPVQPRGLSRGSRRNELEENPLRAAERRAAERREREEKLREERAREAEGRKKK